MDVSRINSAGFMPPGQLVSTAAKARAEEKQAVQQERVTLSQTQDEQAPLTYGKPGATPATPADPDAAGTAATAATPATQGPQDLAAMLEESDRKVSEFMQMLGGMLQKQGLEWSKVISGEQHLSADPQTIKAAQAAIAPDGEFGVKNTAQRILSFARSMIGDDPSRLDAVRQAVSKGFDDAKAALGGALPDISKQTYDTIMAEFDRWSKDGLPANGPITLPDNSGSNDGSTTTADGGTNSSGQAAA
ncbi:hypothetical protein [Vogesella sp. LIG4]|uniref:hypothetical protein n=1 Tax=Vogesella sp. LIG4 TaxID=1192162 RepID=UPI00081FAA8B|nr:hypothetical protein [Vogesella sp. LIG4]SCK30254.1 hypothetical protein PSELUDRAFT_3758 [Vogesella sp. LIG4]